MDRVKEVMIKDLVFCTPMSKIKESRDLMEKYHYSKIPVVNTIQEKRIIGMVSLGDLSSSTKKIIECMSKNSKAIEEDSTVDECLKIMIMNNVDQVPVIDKQGHLCGMVMEKMLLSR